MLGNKNASVEEIILTIKLIDSLGSIDYAKKLAKKYIEKSKKALSNFAESQDKKDLINLSKFIFTRQH